MANSYTQIYLQVVFSVAYRDAIIYEEFREKLYRYIIAGFEAKGHNVLAIGGMADHIHILFRYNIKQPLPELVQSIKIQSTKWINDNRYTRCHFAWQAGYGAFSYSQSQVNAVVSYINNQKQHHQKQAFIDEYRQMLAKFKIMFEDKYTFQELK
ncbi:MAG: IS200/IS605 family transposase [Coprobacter sp.]|nr:IS200/IS605 family transposase [Coprobacter sp.]